MDNKGCGAREGAAYRLSSAADRLRSSWAVGWSELLDSEYEAHETNADDSKAVGMRRLWHGKPTTTM